MNNILLIGNPNTGKSTLFNSLTGANAHTGNWHGVTVEQTSKEFKYLDKTFSIIDLPGIYSMSPISFEERVTVEYVYSHLPCKIINIVDANNIYRNLYLTQELLRLKIPMLLVINKTSNNCLFDGKMAKRLSESLGIDAILIDVKNKTEVLKLKEKIYNNCFKISNQNYNYFNLENIINIIKNKKNNTKLNLEYLALKIAENDDIILNKIKLNAEELQQINNLKNDIGIDIIAKENYAHIKKILKQIGYNKIITYGKSRLDKILLNKYLSIPIFFLILLFIFYITFFSIGSFLGEQLSNFTQNIFGSFVMSIVKSATSSEIIHSFFASGVLGGIGTVFSFLPQVVILFVCLGLLEDSGYLSRVAFCMDDIFGKVGLSGKSVYTLLMGMGCSTTACITARTMEDKNSKIKSAMLTPYMSCTAKLPIYIVIGSAFFGAKNIFVIFALYLLGVVIALLLSVFYEKTFLKSNSQSFIMEFPAYRIVPLKRIAKIMIDNIKSFLIRIGSLLVSVNIIVWILSNFSFSLKYVALSSDASMLETFGKVFAPIFTPLGFNNWGAVSALFAGLIAKEVIVSSIAIINGVNEKEGFSAISRSLRNTASIILFSPASSISYMTFCLLYSPCFATAATLCKEIGKKWTFISILVQFIIAYLVSFVLYQSINIILAHGILNYLVIVLVIIIIGYVIACLFNKLKNKKCRYCKGKCN